MCKRRAKDLIHEHTDSYHPLGDDCPIRCSEFLQAGMEWDRTSRRTSSSAVDDSENRPQPPYKAADSEPESGPPPPTIFVEMRQDLASIQDIHHDFHVLMPTHPSTSPPHRTPSGAAV